jgi:hypothetical protein
VIEMVVREEEPIDLGRTEPRLDQLVGSRRSAVEHDVVARDLNDV